MDQPGLNAEYISTFKDLTSGTIGGMCGLLIGQPLDRVKVLSQTSSMLHPTSPLSPPPTRIGTLATLLLLTRREGFFALWKGVGGPILGAAPLNALAFAGNGKTLRYLDNSPQPHTSPPSSRPYSHYLVAGCVGGFTQTFAAVPAELVKVRLQVQQTAEKRGGLGAVLPMGIGRERVGASAPKNALAMIRHIYQVEGLKGFMRGFSITALRDVPSYGVYFLVYEVCKDALLALPARSPSPFLPSSSTSSSSHPLSFSESSVRASSVPFASIHAPPPPFFSSPVLPMLISGALAGASSWLSCYPVDVVKSVIQTQHSPGRSVRMLPISRELYARGGWRAFFRGLSPTLVRSVPVNAVTFTVYEHTQLLWEHLWPTHPRHDTAA